MEPFALHAESVPGDPLALRWVIADGLLPVGRVTAAPGRLGVMVAPGGPIVRALAERGALWTWLAGGDWAESGADVRDAIVEAAQHLEAWQVEAADDEVLRLVADDVIERSLGAYIASHGGRICLLSVADGVAEMSLDGACAHCPAAGLTLYGRIERELRQRVGPHVVVHAAGQSDAQPGRPSWLPKLLRR